MLLPLGDDSGEDDHVPYVTYALIVVNIVVFFLTLFHAGIERHIAIVTRWGFTPASPRPETLVTSLFLHGGLLHLFGNMLFLWMFGATVEWCLGHVGYASAYFVTGILGSLVTLAVDPGREIPSIGASGAISGVLGIYIVAFPHNRIRALLWVFF